MEGGGEEKGREEWGGWSAKREQPSGGSRLLLCCRRMAFLAVGRVSCKCDSLAPLEVPLKVNPAGVREESLR